MTLKHETKHDRKFINRGVFHMLVKDLYLDAITLEQSSLAHYLYHLLAEGIISADDPIESLNLDQADHQKVAEMIQTNLLGFHKVGIYSLKRNAKEFVFIFAHNKQEAIEFYTETFQQSPLNCHEYSLDFELARGKGVISFRDMRKEYERFPVIAGFFTRGE